MPSYSAKLRDLVRRLAKKTDQGDLKWEVSSNASTAITTLNAGHIQVKMDRDSNGENAIRISVFDADGELKSSFDDTELTEPSTEYTPQVQWFGAMNDLLRSALRSAKGEDAIINALLDELDEDVPF